MYLDRRLWRFTQGGASIGQPGDVARAVCYLAAPLTRHIQATVLDISGGESIAL